ncbi:MAG: 16S rRNA (cytidine(1402)-2'-O)-methyltransferase [Patescibacteria group bacterium]
MAKLYLVSTPIGNLGDLTLRAKRILSEVEVIACEDTRKTGLLLQALRKERAKLISYYEENELIRIPEIINLLKQGKNVALVSNAGTPTISDPGYKLVRECINQSIQVEAIPGASAILTALVSSGLPTDKFLFLGYLPKKAGKRQKLLNDLYHCTSTIVQMQPTIILFESPYRLLETLQDLKEMFGDIKIVICRELTKIHEEIRREKISDSIKHFEQVKPKGEFVILFNIPLK